ncbi:hypothetical protein BaRGS_00019893, partial [Batillaria attramentaria]
YNTRLYAFANGDILFTESLMDTLKVVLASRHLPLDVKPLLVMGQRTNVRWVRPEETSFSNLTRISKERGKLTWVNAIDYFVVDRKFPWIDIPDLVIGRVWYDNWLVSYCIQRRFIVIDATKTLLAVHQTGKAGISEGSHRPTKWYNLNLLKRLRLVNQTGRRDVRCAPWVTSYTRTRQIYIRYVRIPKNCVQ